MILGGLLVAAAACSSGGGGGGGGTGGHAPAGCVPGQSTACVGPGSCAGYQVCAPDGMSFEACVCGSTSSNTSSGSTSSSTASSSSGGAPCTNMLEGSFTLQNATDIATLAPYCGITGDLTLASAGIPSIVLPSLATIGGQFLLMASGLNQLSLPALTMIGNRFLASSGYLQELDLPSLTSAEDLDLGGMTLTTLNVPKLTTVHHGMSLSFAPSATISFPALVSVGVQTPGSLHLVGGASLSAPVLSDCPGVDLGGQTGSVDLPALTSLEHLGYCDLGGDCPAGSAPTITMNALTSITDLEIRGAGSPKLSFASLTQIGYGTLLAGSLSVPNLTTMGATPNSSGNTIAMDSFLAPKLTSLMGVTTLSAVSTVNLGALQTVSYLTVKDTKLTELDLPALTSGSIAFTFTQCQTFRISCSTNPSLVQLEAPKWTSGSVFFGDSTFPTCRAAAICTQLGQKPVDGSCWCTDPPMCSNQATSPCP